MPIDTIIIKIFKTPYLVKKTQKVNKQKLCCKNSWFVLVVPTGWAKTKYIIQMALITGAYN